MGKLARTLYAGLGGPGDEGATVTEDAAEYVARVVTDTDSGIGRWHDGRHYDDVYGRFCWPGPDYRNGYGYQHRPDGFDGAARKLTTRDGYVWWQPPADVTGDHLAQLEERVRAYFTEQWWHVGVVVTYSTICACCGRASEQARASLWGVESDCGEDYMLEILEDLIEESVASKAV